MWNKLKMMFSSIWKFVLPLLKVFSSSAGKAVLQSAIKIVSEIAITMANSEGIDKKNAAFKLIIADLKRQGIQIGFAVGESVINAAIETAVQYLKNKGIEDD